MKKELSESIAFARKRWKDYVQLVECGHGCPEQIQAIRDDFLFAESQMFYKSVEEPTKEESELEMIIKEDKQPPEPVDVIKELFEKYPKGELFYNLNACMDHKAKKIEPKPFTHLTFMGEEGACAYYWRVSVQEADDLVRYFSPTPTE